MTKTVIYSILISIFLLAACRQENISDNTTSTGILALEELSIQNIDVESISSRSVDSDLYIRITGISKDTIITYAPGEFSGKIELPVGTYNLEAYNEAGKPIETNNPNKKTKEKNQVPTENNQAKYYLKEEFSIEAEKINYLAIKVPMVNAAATFKLQEGLNEYFTHISFKIGTSENEMTELKKEGEHFYFDCNNSNNMEVKTVLHYTLHATNSDNETFESKGSYGDNEGETLCAGKLYVITYNLATRLFHITID